MYNYEFIKKQINKYNYISFDMFDTLIKRNINAPTDLFQLIEEKYNIKNFKKIRIESEITARNKSNHKEPNINDIYKEINIKNKEKIKKIEIDLELKLCQQNIDFYNIYKYAKDKGKKIIITTDIYLNKDIIKNILSNANIEYDYMFLSNDIKLNKHHGTIYPYILNKLNIQSKELLHIGDSKRADYLIPKFLGIKSILIPKKINKLNYFKDYSPTSIDENIIMKFINNNISINEDVYYKLGYEILGIILLGYSKWLKKNLEDKDIKKVFFLSREGALLKKAFDLICDVDIETKYLYVSRRSTRPTLLKNIKTLENVFEVCKMRRIVDLESFFINVGLDINNYSTLLKKYNVKKEDKIKNIVNFEEIFNEIKKDIIKNSKEEERNLIKYLEQEDFKGKIAISDIGWAGTMQNSLNKITCQNKIYTDITGFYIGESKSAYKNIKVGNKQYGYLFNYKNDEGNLNFFLGLFENLFTSNHGTTIKYENNKKIVKPILAKYEYKKAETKIFRNIQKGAIDFINQIKTLDESNLEISNEFALYGIEKLGMYPTLNDVKLFENITYLDSKKFKLIENNNTFIYYIFHPQTIINDFFKSGWKAGFIKKLLKIKLPYYKILMSIYHKKKVGGKNYNG